MMKIFYITEHKEIEFSKDTGFIITEIDGLSANEISMEESTTANQVGSTLNSQKVEPRVMTIDGHFPASYENRRKIIDTILPLEKARIRIVTEDYDLFVEGYPQKTPDLGNNPFNVFFQFEFKCAFPYWIKSDEGIIDFVSYESRFRLPRSFSGTVPWKISEKIVNQLNTIKNEGSVPIGFVVTFKAIDTVKNPELLKVNTQEKMTFRDLTMEVGDVLTISTVANQHYVRLIHDGIESNVFFKTTFDFSFFQLDVGNNPIRFDAESGVGNLEVNIDFHTTYAGV